MELKGEAPHEWLLSRRDRLIVARHEVPGMALDTPEKLDVGQSQVFGPKGQESIAHGLPWVLGL
jgi:hypothetical protein